MARAVDQQSRELMDRILRIGDTAEVSTNKGMKTTNVAGYPLLSVGPDGVVPNQMDRVILRRFYFSPMCRVVR